MRGGTRRQLDTDTLRLDPFGAPKRRNGNIALCPERPVFVLP